MLNFQHTGLYFSQNNINQAKKYAKREPFKIAWELLRDQPTLDLPASTQWDGMRYRFEGDEDAGSKAVHDLNDGSAFALDEDMPYLDGVMETVVLAQSFELIRSHRAFTPSHQAAWRDLLFERTSRLNVANDLLHVEQIWQALMNMAVGIVLEREPIVTDAAHFFRKVVDQDIHPRGYISQAVGGENTAARDGGSLLRMLLSVKGLVLMAEAAKHIGLELWAYSNRGVSVVTAALYPLYYYYYPEKWQWDEGIEIEAAEQLFKLHGSYLELLNLHLGRPTKAIDLILKEIRPIYDVTGGGLTTLSHGVPLRRGLFG